MQRPIRPEATVQVSVHRLDVREQSLPVLVGINDSLPQVHDAIVMATVYFVNKVEGWSVGKEGGVVET